jgi:16S rRNA processing protein RimM
VYLYNPGTDLFDHPREVELLLGKAEKRKLKLRVRSGAGKRIIGTFEGIERLEEAEALVGAEIEVSLEALPSLEEGTWYQHELIGLPVHTEGGRSLGRLVEIYEQDELDVWVVRGKGDDRFIQATKEQILSVDRVKGITVTEDAGEAV